MIWVIDEIVASLSADLALPADFATVSLPFFDRETGTGIGVDNNGAVCLVLPGLEKQSAFETKALVFDPWCETKLLKEQTTLPKCAILRCKVDRTDKALLRVVVGILLSLVDLQVRFQDAGNAIWALKTLFSEGFESSVQINVVRGLIGELLLIDSSANPKSAISCWHIDFDDRYDYSINNARIEIKTTTSSVRQHRFTSRQLPPIHGVKLWVASVQLAEVAVGATVSSLFDRIVAKVDLVSAQKLLDVIVETIGLPPGAILEPQFDLDASAASIRLFVSDVIPTPAVSPGVSDLKWTAYLDELNGLAFSTFDQIVNDSIGE